MVARIERLVWGKKAMAAKRGQKAVAPVVYLEMWNIWKFSTQILTLNT